MRKLSAVAIGIAVAAAVLGGVGRLMMITPIGVPARVYAGVAVILLLLSIALNTLSQER